MIDYSVEIDIGDGYFTVEIANEVKTGDDPIDDMPIFRKSIDELTIKNYPYSGSANSYKLFDLISDEPPDTTFTVKITEGANETIGYFGQVDCNINEDRSIITIKPTISDQYTDFLENYDTDIDVFGITDLIENGDFDVWTNGLPNGWLSLVLLPTKEILLTKNCAVLTRNLIFTGSMVQSVSGIQAGNNIDISFLNAYVGSSGISNNLKYTVTLTGSSTYQLQSDGSWLESATSQDINYRTNIIPLPKESITKFDSYQIITGLAPVQGVLTISFYGTSTLNDSVYITDVSLKSDSTNIIDLNINLLDDKIVSKYQFDIQDKLGNYLGLWFRANPLDSQVRQLGDYFNTISPVGSPNTELLDDSNHGPHNTNGIDEFRYPAWMDVFTNEESSPFYKAEITELTIYKGGRWRSSFATRWRRHIKGLAIFSREEYYKTDYFFTAQDEIDGRGIEGELETMEDAGLGLGWVAPDNAPPVNGKRLWVRTPFNGAYTNVDWNIETIDTTGGKINDFDWEEKLTSRIAYPIAGNSQSLTTAVDFRDICRKIYRSTHNSRLNKEVYSAFFWNDSPYISELNIETGQNYHTHNTNKLNNIAVVHSTDLKTDVVLNSDENKLKLSFKNFFEDLNKKFNGSLIWFIDTDLNLHVEHKKFIDLTEDFVNILGDNYNYLGEYSSFDFDKDKIYATTKFVEFNSGYEDFNRSDITFKKIVSNKRGEDLVKDITSQYISTDMLYAIENPGELKNGMILVATEEIDGETVVKYGIGLKTNTNVLNGDLSIATLLQTYANYEGVWIDGKINGNDVIFPFTLKVKQGSDIVLKGIVPENFLLTKLGIATATQKIYDFGKETTTFSPIYRHFDYFLVMGEDDLIEL